MSTPLVNEITRAAEGLSMEQQQTVLDYIRDLHSAPTAKKPASALLTLAGTLPPEDAAEMLRAIEEGCEQIDHNGW